MYSKNLVKAYQMAPTYIPNSLAKKPMKERKSLGPVSREFANIEAEGGETVLIPNKGGLPAHYNINGPRHHEGGVPLAIPAESFIYSDTRAMKIKDPVLLAEFAMPEKKGGYTPAEIAKRYDINPYRKILQSPDSDALQVSTAEQVIANFQVKLGKLALVQESIKGFPNGIPTVAMPYLAKYQIEPESVMPTDMQPEQQQQMPQGPEEEMQEPMQEPMGQEMMEGEPMMRYGGSLPHYQMGGGRQARRQRRAERQAMEDYYYNAYMQQMQQANSQVRPLMRDTYDPSKPDPSTGIFLQYDENGNPYYHDGRGVRVDKFDDLYARGNGGSDVTLKEGESIVVKDGKRYIVKKTKKPAVADKSKVKKKEEAITSGDIYEEDGKYYKIKEYDVTKPIASTKSGKTNYTGDLEEDKKKAKVILDKLAATGGAEYHDAVWTSGGNTYQPGWHIKDSARSKINTAEKDFLTKFLSYGSESGVLGVPDEKEYQVSLQTSGDTGFFGYTDPKFYEYRFWQARNPGKTADDWDAVSADDKLKNRKNMFYSLGMDINDPHISANINNPDQLYTPEFVKGNKRVRTAREIKDKDGNVVNNLNYVDAVENFFNPGEFRPGLSDDKKLGLEHADAFTFERTVDPLEDTEEEESRLLDTDITPYTPNYKSADKNTPWWKQDIVNTAGALGNYYSINKYKPWKGQMQPYIPDPTFYDPNREIAALQETAGMAEDVMRGTSGSSQSFGARVSDIQGKAAESIANTMGKYNNLNVGVANEFAYKKADLMNTAQLKNLDATQKYIDSVNTVNQNYDNAKREAGDELRGAYVNAITNRANAQVLNSLYPNYNIDPSSGGMLNFIKGKDVIANQNAMATRQDAEEYAKFRQNHPELQADEAARVWVGLRSKGDSGSVNDGYYDAYQNIVPQYNVGPQAMDNYYLSPDQPEKAYGGMVPFNYTTGYNW
jgi:hypothetical protein